MRADLYEDAFRLWEMSPAGATEGYGPAGILYTFDNAGGQGEYWAYFHDELFAVNSFRMNFRQAGEMRYRHLEHLALACYDEAQGVVQNSGAPLRAGSVSVYVGASGGEYHARYEAGASVRATSITLSPDYYRGYLQARFGPLDDVRAAFRRVDGRRDLPELIALLVRARTYRGKGVSAELFYEGVIAQVVSLVLEKARELREDGRPSQLRPDDQLIVDELCGFIATHLDDGSLTCDALAERAYIGQTKLKRLFKEATGKSPSAYVAEQKMARALELLAQTDLPIGQVARSVGYDSPSAFTAAFHRHHGFAPTAARAG